MELKIYSVKEKMPDLINQGLTDECDPDRAVWESKPVLWFGKTSTGVPVVVPETLWMDNRGDMETIRTEEQYIAQNGSFYYGAEITITHWAEIPNVEEQNDGKF